MGNKNRDFFKKEKELSSILRERCEGMSSFLGDTIMDINGDKVKDYILFSYPSSGCCLANTDEIHLYNNQNDAFEGGMRVLNPTYSPKEKIIRGVEYGHPGEGGIYKLKWVNNYDLDTVEYIYPYYLKKDFYIKTKKLAYRPTEKNGELLSSLPVEYADILGIKWFLDDLD